MKHECKHSVVPVTTRWHLLTFFFLNPCHLWMRVTAWQSNLAVPSLHTSQCAAATVATTALFASSSDPSESDDTNSDETIPPHSSSNDQQIQKHLQDRHDAFQIEKTRQKLESANVQSFLKRKPRKLPYEDARRWVQANLGCDTAEEYEDLVANGNLRTPYIPKRPEEWYTGTREWISWEHFLKGCFDEENPSAVKPRTGVFD